jgi:hypothetical protein
MNDAPPTKLKRVSKPGSVRRGKATALGPLAKRAVVLFQQQALSGQFKPIEDTLLEAGYAPNSARQITNVMAGIRPHVEPIVAKMEAHREKVMERMEVSVTRATYGELVRSLDVSTRNIRLLTGKSTQNFALDAEHRVKLDALIENDT